MGTMKNRGLASFIIAHARDWKLSETFTPIDVRPHVLDAFPHASLQVVANAILTVCSKGVMIRTLQGHFRLSHTAARELPASSNAIDLALDALATVEQVLRDYKSKIEKLDELRALLK